MPHGITRPHKIKVMLIYVYGLGMAESLSLLQGTMWIIYPYASGLLHQQWGNYRNQKSFIWTRSMLNAFRNTLAAQISIQCPIVNKYSLLIHRIKVKSPANFSGNEQHVFVCWFITFQSVLLCRYYNDKKPTGYWRYYHSRCPLTGCHGTCHRAWRPHHERWAYTSNFVQYISGV